MSSMINFGGSNTGCITGVRTTGAIDYLSFTLPDEVCSVSFVEDVLGIPFESFSIAQNGRNGYRTLYRYGSITVLTNGAEGGMGHNITLTGTGCSRYQDRLLLLTESVFNSKGHFTRCDLKIDDHQGLLDMNEIQTAVSNGLVVAKCKKIRNYNEHDKVSGVFTGRGVYLGSRKSGMFVRIYDKALEQGVDHHWIRVELELKGNKASAAMKLTQKFEIGELVSGLLKSYVSFREYATDSNRYRWPVTKWWDLFLAGVDRLKLEVPIADNLATQEGRLAWFVSNSATFAELVDTCGTGIIPAMYQEGKQKLVSRLVH